MSVARAHRAALSRHSVADVAALLIGEMLRSGKASDAADACAVYLDGDGERCASRAHAASCVMGRVRAASHVAQLDHA